MSFLRCGASVDLSPRKSKALHVMIMYFVIVSFLVRLRVFLDMILF